jgi:hypothetical protein
LYFEELGEEEEFEGQDGKHPEEDDTNEESSCPSRLLLNVSAYPEPDQSFIIGNLIAILCIV